MQWISLVSLSLSAVQAQRCEHTSEVELYILQDGTASYQNRIEETKAGLQRSFPRLQANFTRGFKAGMGLFGDRPVMGNNPVNVCFKPNFDMTSDAAQFTQQVSQTRLLDCCRGGPREENGLEALVFVSGTGAQFTPLNQQGNRKILRLVLLITDEPDRLKDSPQAYNSRLREQIDCTFITSKPLPTPQQVAGTLTELDVHLVAMVPREYVQRWNEDLHQLMQLDPKRASASKTHSLTPQ